MKQLAEREREGVELFNRQKKIRRRRMNAMGDIVDSGFTGRGLRFS